MRTTVDLPDDVRRLVVAISQRSGMSISETVGRLLRAALAGPGAVRVSTSDRTGLRVVTTGCVVRHTDVRALDDDV